MQYLGHAADGREQRLSDHLLKTAELAEIFASQFGAGPIGCRCGLLHDIGKYSDKFQRRIRGSSESVDHSTAGVLEAFRLNDIPSAFCIAGHHSGLPDLGNRKTDDTDSPNFFGKIKRRAGVDIEDYSSFRKEIMVPEADIPRHLLQDKPSAFFFIRMLFSCLVDADYLDTEAFFTNNAVKRGGYDDLQGLFGMLTDKIAPWLDTKNHPVTKNELNAKRSEILRSLMGKAAFKRGLFTITVPTGGGKTISSMAFALRHALENNMRRIIYVIPYTSIIEQTQQVFEDIFGRKNVVAHYSTVSYDSGEHGDESDPRRLATENWDAPIILTTSVQFFESLYSNRPSRCRKLHNIANSVIIFDEAQMLPMPNMIPCLFAISQLVKNYGCTAVLCTATQPSLRNFFERLLPECPPVELCPDVDGMYEFFRRVRYVNDGRLSNEELANRLNGEEQVLCIVNSRKQAQSVYAMLRGEGLFHLSTTMTPCDRRAALDQIKQRLNEGAPCRVISTSLVEAGVDVDFPVVYRCVAGLDSIIQAGGRCNREGKRDATDSLVHIFMTEDRPPQSIRQNIAAAERVIRNFEDISSPQAVKAYFDFLYYTLKDERDMDKNEVMRGINAGEMPFATVAERFRIIDNAQYTLYIPKGEGILLVQRLREHGPSRELMRELGRYSVGVYPGHFRSLLETGAAELVSEDSAILVDMSLYSEKTGLAFGVEEGNGIFIIN